jgi:integrase
MLILRRRGRLWHIRGSIRIGRETRIIKEHATGCDRKEDAEAYRARLETTVRQEMLKGSDGRAERMTVADAGLSYMNRPGGVRSYDLWRLDQINNEIGDWPIARANAAFASFVKQRCGGLTPATVDRFRCVLQAAVNHAAREGEFDPPKVRRIARIQNKRIRFLSKDQEARLLDAYADHVRPIAITLALQGLRIGEALRLDWQHVNWASNSLFIAETKSGVPRTVNMQDPMRKALHALWVAAGSPGEGRVFLNRLGVPYADPRQYVLPGGSPIKKAHATACRRAGIDDFTVHDWRHHLASWCVMSGIDLETLRQEGGWKSLRMVERYATVSAEHRANTMRKLGTGWAVAAGGEKKV